VAPSQRLRRRQAEAGRVDAMGCVGPCYPCFAVFLLLGLRGVIVILAFYLGLYIGSYRVMALYHFPFSFSSSYVRSESCLDFSFNQKREGGR
jgi:hypothetical protein